ncbi:MAG: hypothetical protein ACRC8G_09045 [Plesiomonas shigelloides]
MTDRELLELSAKAIGGEYRDHYHGDQYLAYPPNWNGITWNPLTDDGDAMRLAMELGFHIKHWVYACQIEDSNGHEWPLVHMSECEGGICHAARRAIVIAAAEIGKGL